jgi:hypothetical protein
MHEQEEARRQEELVVQCGSKLGTYMDAVRGMEEKLADKEQELKRCRSVSATHHDDHLVTCVNRSG